MVNEITDDRLAVLEEETEYLYSFLKGKFAREPEVMMDRSAALVGIHARLSQMKGKAEEILLRCRGEAVRILREDNPKITAKELELRTDMLCAHAEKVVTDITECVRSCNEQITVLITLISYEKSEMNFTNKVQTT